MAHNLMQTKKGYAYAGVGQLAWHKLGVTVDNAMTSAEAIELAQLDYEVGIRPLHVHIANQWQHIASHNVTYNKNTNDIFGVVGSRYEVIQNNEAFDFLDGIVDDKLAMFHTAGALGRGETMFVSVKLPNNIRMRSLPDEQIENYLLFTSSHDGTGSIKVIHTPIRVVCNNTLTAALERSSGGFTIKHTKNARNRLSAIQNLFINLNKNVEKIAYRLDMLQGINFTEQDLDSFLTQLVINKDDYVMENGIALLKKDISSVNSNTIYQLRKNIFKGVGQDIINPMTGYGIYNGVTTYLQNGKKFKSDEDKFKTLYQKSNLADRAMKLITTFI